MNETVYIIINVAVAMFIVVFIIALKNRNDELEKVKKQILKNSRYVKSLDNILSTTSKAVALVGTVGMGYDVWEYTKMMREKYRKQGHSSEVLPECFREWEDIANFGAFLDGYLKTSGTYCITQDTKKNIRRDIMKCFPLDEENENQKLSTLDILAFKYEIDMLQAGLISEGKTDEVFGTVISTKPLPDDVRILCNAFKFSIRVVKHDGTVVMQHEGH